MPGRALDLRCSFIADIVSSGDGDEDGDVGLKVTTRMISASLLRVPETTLSRKGSDKGCRAFRVLVVRF